MKKNELLLLLELFIKDNVNLEISSSYHLEYVYKNIKNNEEYHMKISFDPRGTGQYAFIIESHYTITLSSVDIEKYKPEIERKLREQKLKRLLNENK
jgi:hypothetical protein